LKKCHNIYNIHHYFSIGKTKPTIQSKSCHSPIHTPPNTNKKLPPKYQHQKKKSPPKPSSSSYPGLHIYIYITNNKTSTLLLCVEFKTLLKNLVLEQLFGNQNFQKHPIIHLFYVVY
jgi:hypothetical protein